MSRWQGQGRGGSGWGCAEVVAKSLHACESGRSCPIEMSKTTKVKKEKKNLHQVSRDGDNGMASIHTREWQAEGVRAASWGGPAMHWSWELCSCSFASVVKELDDNDDHTGTICDLVPIEDDISILNDTQQPLRSFHEESVALALNWNAVLCLLTVALLSLGFHASIHAATSQLGIVSSGEEFSLQDAEDVGDTPDRSTSPSPALATDTRSVVAKATSKAALDVAHFFINQGRAEGLQDVHREVWQ
ncbi:hypothetical protein EDB85DRAFT_1888131 [Lactarius pseudohatsudake]|nr:hypothetical protein EDB85DRAFT_1888131 [Lactarius pseudohatsudake]